MAIPLLLGRYWWMSYSDEVPLPPPPGGLPSSKEYHNLKNFYSIVLMAMVDSHYRFVWASCGFPGNSHDAIIFKSTDLWSRIQQGHCIPNIGQSVDGVTVPPLIVGDSAFPLCTWLMKPYTNAVLTSPQRNFNYRLSWCLWATEREVEGIVEKVWKCTRSGAHNNSCMLNSSQCAHWQRRRYIEKARFDTWSKHSSKKTSRGSKKVAPNDNLFNCKRHF